MDVKSYSDVRAKFNQYMDELCENHTALIITRSNKKKPVVMVSLEDYNSWQETVYLMRDPQVRVELLEGIAQVEKMKVEKHEADDIAAE